jgi:hypothetical protein
MDGHGDINFSASPDNWPSSDTDLVPYGGEGIQEVIETSSDSSDDAATYDGDDVISDEESEVSSIAGQCTPHMVRILLRMPFDPHYIIYFRPVPVVRSPRNAQFIQSYTCRSRYGGGSSDHFTLCGQSETLSKRLSSVNGLWSQ